jgi:hypothetical protein
MIVGIALGDEVMEAVPEEGGESTGCCCAWLEGGGVSTQGLGEVVSFLSVPGLGGRAGTCCSGGGCACACDDVAAVVAVVVVDNAVFCCAVEPACDDATLEGAEVEAVRDFVTGGRALWIAATALAIVPGGAVADRLEVPELRLKNPPRFCRPVMIEASSPPCALSSSRDTTGPDPDPF